LKTDQKPGAALICLALLITIATLVIAGCMESAQEQQGQMPVAREKLNEQPVSTTIVTTRTVTAPVQPSPAQPSPGPGLSTAGITIDPIGDKKVADRFTITATTSLPTGTNLFWQILPDTGTPPTGLDGNSQMSVGGNNQVTKGDGTANRISQAVDLGGLVPGKYVVIVGEMKGAFSDFKIGDRYGYTYFTIR
jgi:hypothetical protein